MNLEAIGWNDRWAAEFRAAAAPGTIPARVAVEHKRGYRVCTADGDLAADVSGRLRHRAPSRSDLPAVGDWVSIRLTAHDRKAVINAILPRKSRFLRKVAGRTAEQQVVAANIDTVFLVSGLDHEFNERRIERYLVMAWESGSRPVIVLNKADLCPTLPAKLAAAEAVAGGVPVHAVSAREPAGLDPLASYLGSGQTVALLGSSGVGKTTIINSLIGTDTRPTTEVRESDSRGRHTTSWRELIELPRGGAIIDTPGMRELQLWEAGVGVQEAFQDITALSRHCHFHDCRHDQEPRCAVRQAVAEGGLAPERLENYLKIQQELELLARKQDPFKQLAYRKRERSIHKLVRKHTPRG